MLRYALACSLFFTTSILSFAQLRSPEQYLGYAVGSRYTPHARIVDYFRSIAAAMPNTVHLEAYGTTHEGRPLLVTYVSSPANIARLEAIRQANLALSRDSRATPAAGTPAIVWLSFNVHGNETSSSEAAMLTLYALADPSNAKTKQWLEHTVVVIDPCINPDGRDRYVNWFGSVAGREPNPDPQAREHVEPWPGGRTNHYYFDLNRDWAWQTQVESQQRMALYNRWLPQVHVDFHEMDGSSAYYFAPAAQPYHEVITGWQREFQNIIGRNHARYFDEKGWLYFTKEYYDLLYPSYGDTYPTYSGSIGMTYEQAGGGEAGLALVTAGGDTLTLHDRVLHHYTTALSTIEVSSSHASRLLSEFQKFYREANTEGFGRYKTYVIKYTDNDAERIRSLLQLLDKNEIRYSSGKTGSAKGYHYVTGKEESFSLSSNDIIVSAIQPRSALVKVLFEPSTFLVDTVAYDITAWSLPYAYGLNCFASTQRLQEGGKVLPQKVNNLPSDAYGYVIRWNGMSAVRLVTQLLQKGIRLRYNERPFETAGQSFDRGAVLILKTSNQYVPDLWKTVTGLANQFGVSLTPVTSGWVDKGYDFGSDKVHPFKNRRVAVLTGDEVAAGAAGEVWYYFDHVINYPVTLVNARDLPNISLNAFDVLILPGGNYSFLNEKTTAEPLRNWVMAGGNLVAMEWAVDQLSKLEWAIHSKKAETNETKDVYAALKRYDNRDRDVIPTTIPGSIFKVELDNSHPLAFGFPDHYYTLKTDDHVYEFIREGGWNVGYLRKDRQVAGFVGSRLNSKLQDGLLFGVQDLGRGHITYLADDVLFRSFWENGKLLFSNAVFLVGQ